MAPAAPLIVFTVEELAAATLALATAIAATPAYQQASAALGQAADDAMTAVQSGVEKLKEKISTMMSNSEPTACEECDKAAEGEEAAGDSHDGGDEPPRGKKASNSKPGDKVRTPDTHPEDFSRNRSGQRTNIKTGEVWEKSHTQHSGGPEWKVGSRPGMGPRRSSKITVRGGPAGQGGGTIIKID